MIMMMMNLLSDENESKFQTPTLMEQSLLIEHDVEEENVAEQFFSAVDKIEDEFDKNTYEELIPLNIRLELENRIFGWSHLSSVLLGHVWFPLSSYVSTFCIVSVIGLRYVHSNSTSYSSSTDECLNTCQMYYGWQCLYQKVMFNGKITEEALDPEDPVASNLYPILGISIRFFLFLRQFLSLWSAFNSFRVVRRRRQVWLSHSATEYFKDSKTQEELRIVDRTTLLGKMRSKLQVRRMRKRIQRAEKRFEKRDKIRIHKYSSSIKKGYESEDTYKANNSDDSAMLDDHNVQEQTALQIQPKPDATDFVKIYNMYKSRSQEDFSLDLNENVFESNFYARTMPTYAMQSISMDQIRLKSKIKRVSYAHGGFFGAAPFMLANPHWIDILGHLMPDVYVEISRRVVHTPVPQLIHWAENNPVVAAFGAAHELEFSGQIPNIEWDVFLDPHLVQRLDVVLQARDNFITKLTTNSHEVKSVWTDNRDGSNIHKKIKDINKFLESEKIMSNERKIFEFYNTEIEKRVKILLDEMLIAHGNATQLILEQTGLLKNFNFSRVKRTRRTLGGGVFAKYWITTYVQALKMSTVSNLSSRYSPSKTKTSNKSEHPCNENDSLIEKTSDLEGSFHDFLAEPQPLTIDDAISHLKQVTGHDSPLGLVLDLKSRHVPKRVWGQLIDCMRSCGLRVEGIATFYIEDVRNVSSLCVAPVNEVIFFHTAGDLQHACHSGLIREGDSVYFNAGSLFWNDPVRSLSDFIAMLSTAINDFNGDEIKKKYSLEPYARVDHNGDEKAKKGDLAFDSNTRNGKSSTIQQYKDHFKLSIGLYLQEFCVDDEILNILIEYVNKNEHIYDLGFSWGGVNGLTVNGIQPGRFTCTEGLWNQRYVGKRWETNKFPVSEIH